MSSMDATFHAAQYLIYELQNPPPASPLTKLGNGNREKLRTVAEIFRKSKTPAVPPRVPVREVAEEKFQEVNQERS